MTTRTGLALCGTGLLLTVVEVRLFGFDLADDTVGFALVAAGAWAQGRGHAPGPGGQVAWRVAAAAASVAAVAALFAYTGLVGRFLAYPERLWVGVVYLRGLAAGVVGAAVALGLRTDLARSSRRRRLALDALAWVAVTSAVLAVLLQWSGTGYAAPLGVLLQLAVAGSGAAALAAALACLLLTRSAGGSPGS